jgi:hypothetical protein
MNSWRKTRAQGRPGNSGPAACAFFCPGPQLGNFTQKIFLASSTKPSARPASTRRSGAEGSDGRFLRSQLRRIGLGRCPQARPCRQRPHPITITSVTLAKPELSTLHKTGTFYFALTAESFSTVWRNCRRDPGYNVAKTLWGQARVPI